MAFSEALEGTDVSSKGVKKKDVKQTLRNGLTVNVIGMGAALLGLQAMIGMLVCIPLLCWQEWNVGKQCLYKRLVLSISDFGWHYGWQPAWWQRELALQVAKTLTSASANPFFANTASSSFNPVLAIDVFLVQAATNTLLSHFTSLVICFLLLRAVDR
jgi:hypothetical protein